ncbi:MAG: signal recognition particle receptor subunit alpha, partial [Bacteroidales bacterium]|nr:signal recognition particle receptor subunit alpha [Bacteroidales bacterium]
MGLFNWKKKDKEKTEERPLDSGLEKTKRSLFEKLTHAIAGKSVVDDEVLDSLEEVLIASDVGVETTQNIIERLEARVARDKYLNTDEVNRYLCEEITSLLDAAADGKSTEPFDFSKKP